MNEKIKLGNETEINLFGVNAITESDRSLAVTIEKGELTVEVLKTMLEDKSTIANVACLNGDGTVLQEYSGYTKASEEIVVGDEYMTFTLCKPSIDDVNAIAEQNKADIDYLSAITE